jgi:ankyrin repeat protein
MGCNASKTVEASTATSKAPIKSATSNPKKHESPESPRGDQSTISNTIDPSKPERLYKMLVKAQKVQDVHQRENLLQKVLQHCQEEPQAAIYQNPTTKSTPLHMAVRLLDSNNAKSETLFQVIRALIAINQQALQYPDAGGNVPLHYAVAPSTHFQDHPERDWKSRAVILRHIIDTDFGAAQEYLMKNSVIFESGDATGGCTPLYRVLQTLEDDFDPMGPTLDYTAVVQAAYPKNTGVGNASDGDKPLALLYRRFTRQFDISEKFFPGDNSLPEVVQHRKKYKAAAGNTWKIIELLLRPPTNDTQWGIVHRAVRVETPPDLLRYIVETNAQDLTRVDKDGNLPLHHAAKSKSLPKALEEDQAHRQFPAFYTKYVVDELLYKFPEAASMPDANGNFPLTLAIQSGKQWIGGGIKSLYDAYPDAINQIDLQEHQSLKRALSMAEEERENEEDGEEDGDDMGSPSSLDAHGIIKDEHHDAIMLVQQPDVDISEVVTSMWAHEEDAGVQMLGCVAISKMAAKTTDSADIMQIALSAVAAVVNAMKAHPNEMIVQEKACLALRSLAKADGHREVSMVASGAVAAIVGAMQAHVGDPGVQEEACSAVAAIVNSGGADRATVVASVSGVTAIINSIAAHPTALGVQRGGCLALAALTNFPNANLPDLPRAQTEPLLEAAKVAFPDECAATADLVLSRMAS